MTLGDRLESILRRIFLSRATPGEGPSQPSQPLGPGSAAPGITGLSPDGSGVHVRTQVASTKLLFLTSDCTECRETWRRVATQPDASTVVVTPGPETESARRIKDLSGPDPSPLRVVMSSETWHAYRVTKAPWVIHIEAGKVVRSTQAD